MLKSTAMEPARKEIIVASVFGFFLGICFAFLASNVKNIKIQIKPNLNSPVSQTQNTSDASPSPASQAEPIAFTVTSPEDGVITDKDNITVEGKADTKAAIVITDEVKDTSVIPDPDGSFSAKISLTEEENIIVISAFLDGQQESVQKLVVYEKPEE